LRQAASIDKHLASFSLAPEQSGKIGIKKPAQKPWQKKSASRHQKKSLRFAKNLKESEQYIPYRAKIIS